jgi:hypothetical protein
LNNVSPEKRKARGGPSAWPARSAELHPLYFCLLGKSEICCLC